MALIKLNPNVPVPFIPGFDRKNFKDPLTVHIKFTPAVILDDYISKTARELSEARNNDERDQIGKANDREMFLKQIVKVENFIIEGKLEENVELFYESIDADLRREIVMAIKNQSMLTEGQRKNS